MVQNTGSMSSLLKPATPTPTESIELESREKEVERSSTIENSKDDTDLEQNVVSNTGGEKEARLETSEFEVWWNEPADQDPENPMNWTNKKKWSNIAVMSAITFLTWVAFFCFTVLLKFEF